MLCPIQWFHFPVVSGVSLSSTVLGGVAASVGSLVSKPQPLQHISFISFSSHFAVSSMQLSLSERETFLRTSLLQNFRFLGAVHISQPLYTVAACTGVADTKAVSG